MSTDAMVAAIVGYLILPFVFAFCIVHFGLKKPYQNKHNKPMSALGIIVRTVGIGAIFLLISLLGATG